MARPRLAHANFALQVLHTDDARADKLAVLIVLEASGIVEQTEAGREAWVFTDAGRERLRVRSSLALEGNPLANRPDIALGEATTFELLNMLAADGWKPCAFIKVIRTPNVANRLES